MAINRRSLVLGAVALVLVGLTAYDYTVGIGGRPHRAEKAQPLPVESAPSRSRVAALLREARDLRFYLAHADEVRARYNAIAVPYAEAVANFATLYGPGESPGAVASKRLSALLPAGVELKGLLVSEAGTGESGVIWLEATLSFSSADSAAFEGAVLALGDPAHGMLWKELNVVSETEARTVRANGKLRLLMVEQVE